MKAKLAMLTPLPPAKTGTADYAAALIPEIEKLADLRVYEKPPKHFDPNAFDAVIYQIGNNPFHAGIYETALRHPGIVVLHEPNLHDLIRGNTANNPEAYLREVVYEVLGREQGQFSPSGQQPRTFSMLRRLLDNSRACIVHSLYAAGLVRMKGFRGRVERIPHGIRCASPDRNEFRARLGVKPDQPLAGLFGFLRPDKRAAECLRAFQQAVRRVPGAKILIAGEPHPEVPLAELSDQCIVMGHLPQGDLDGYIAACDVVLNLRWPTFGETSGITARAFGLGRTVVMSDIGAAREYPDDICVRIPCDDYLETVLAETLTWLLSSRAVTEEIGAAAAAWAASNCAWASVAERYVEFARSHAGAAASEPPPSELSSRQIGHYLRRWVEPNTDRARYLDQHETRLARTLQLTPPGTAADRILEMGCYLHITPALRNVHGYGDVRGCYLGVGGSDLRMATARDGETFACTIDLFDCERDPFPYPNGYYSAVLCCELLEHLRRDPMRMMSEIYRVLRDGGVLVLTTPSVVSLRAVTAALRGNHPGFYNRYPDPFGDASSDPKHEREYTPGEIANLLGAAGFTVEHIETGPYGADPPTETALAASVLASLSEPLVLRDDCILAVGRKADLPRDPRPSWLYDAPPAIPEGAHV